MSRLGNIMRCLALVAGMGLAIPAFAEGELTKPPKLIQSQEAEYPEEALKDRVEAEVEFLIDIDETGSVIASEVLKFQTKAEESKSPHEAPLTQYQFVLAAKQALKKLRFSPAEIDGEPAGVRLSYKFVFRLPPKPQRSKVPEVKKIENVQGIVLEKGTRKKVPGAIITIYQEDTDQAFEATSDNLASWGFYNIPQGRWTIEIEAEGYRKQKFEEFVRAGEVLELKYYLKSLTANDYDVVVEADAQKREFTRRSLSIQEIVKIPGTLGDPLLVVENLPGVARNPDGAVVRGSEPQDTSFYIGGVEVLVYDHFGDLRSIVPAAMVEKVDFIPGNYSVAFGRALGGIVDARLKRLNPDQIHGSFDVSLLDIGAYLEVPLTDELAIAVAGRRSHIDVFLDAFIPDDSDLSLGVAPRYYDYQVLVNWHPNNQHNVQLFGIGSDDRMELLVDDVKDVSSNASSASFDNSTTFQRVSVDYKYTPNERFNNSLVLSAGRDKITRNIFGLLNFDFDMLSLTLREIAEWTFSDRFVLRTGMDLENTWNYYDVGAFSPPSEGDPSEPFLGEFLRARARGDYAGMMAGFVESDIKILPWLTFTPGFRVDYFTLLEEAVFEPRALLRAQVLPQFVLKGGVAVVHQEPDISETDEDFGNPDLGPQRAIQYALGFEWKPLDHLLADVTLYYKDLQNLAAQTGEVVVENGEARPLRFNNEGKGRVYGMELLLRHDFKNNFRAWVSYTLNRAERKDPNSSSYRLFDIDQTHIFSAMLSYVLPWDMEFGVRWRYVTGSPTTPIVGAVFVSDDDIYRAIYGEVNSDRLDAFHQLDVRIDKKWTFNSWSLTAYLNVINAYNQENAEGISYAYDFSEQEKVAGLPILPVLGVKGEF